MIDKFVGNVRRDDFRLRTNYPFLKTRIFYTGGYNYLIYIENLSDYPFLDFQKLSDEFDNQIRLFGNPSKLTNVIPENIEKEYENINDNDISKKFEGVFFTESMLLNFLMGKYNQYNIVGLKTDIKHKCFVVFLDYKEESEKNNLQNELDELVLPLNFVIEYKEKRSEIRQEKIKTGNSIIDTYLSFDNVMQIPAYNSQPVKLDFIKRDESLWFDNIDKVYTGEFTKDNLNFFEKDKTSCFVDYTAASNIDLRNVLLMYDTIYLTLPLKNNNELLFNKSFTKENLFYLIEKKRLKIINIQPEERLDVDVLKEASQINPNSVINRRALSLLSVADLYEMNKISIFNDPEVQNFLYDISKILSKKHNIEINEMMAFINWPKQALRASFENFNSNGIWSYGYIGVNKILEKPINRLLNKDLSLELTMTSQNIHLATALGATLFPSFLYDENGKPKSFEEPYANMIGNLLNFYKHANKKTLNSYNDVESFKLNKKHLIYPIDIFSLDTSMPIEDFEKYTSSSAIRNGLNVLFNRLANMPVDEREKEIIKYNNEISIYRKQNQIRLFLSDIVADVLGGIIPTILSGNILPLLLNSSTLRGIISRSDFWKDIEHSINDLNNYINAKQGKLSDIDILSQVNRVAKLR